MVMRRGNVVMRAAQQGNSAVDDETPYEAVTRGIRIRVQP